MAQYYVNATLLNLRSTPSQVGGNENIITRLKNKEVVEVINDPTSGWSEVSCINRNPVIAGYVSSTYLLPVSELSTNNNINYLQPVHLNPNAYSRRSYHGAWQFPLSETGMPKVTDASQTIKSMHEIINYLQVDKSARYQRDVHTYCNVYAYDYCFLSGVFLPRVWWRDKALLDLKDGKAVEPVYDVTVDEINANNIFSWLEQWGEEYKWVRTYDLDELQSKVNEGRVGVICAVNKNPLLSGHICCVVPETDDRKATRVNDKVTCPLLSQAGAVNLPFYNNNIWWIRLIERFKHYGYWYCN